MPKRTRQQKIESSLRKRENTKQVNLRPTVQSTISPIFLADFRKTIIITLSILALEIALYFGRIYNYFKF